jgi:hypothetical protein
VVGLLTFGGLGASYRFARELQGPAARWPAPSERPKSSRSPKGFPPVCRGLVAELNGGDGQMGSDYAYYVVVNRSTKKCSLPPTKGVVGRVSKTKWTILLRGEGEWLVLNPGYSATATMVSVWALDGESDDGPEASEKGEPQPIWSGFALRMGCMSPRMRSLNSRAAAPGSRDFRTRNSTKESTYSDELGGVPNGRCGKTFDRRAIQLSRIDWGSLGRVGFRQRVRCRVRVGGEVGRGVSSNRCRSFRVGRRGERV